ncbi:hypothetical protein B484DRAFT_392945, partial [Ochromonadaceae sp. CCMP2298]
VDLRCLCFGEDSAYQNEAEYTAVTCAIRGAAMLRKRGLLVDAPKGIWLRSDSITSLTWAEKGRVRSELAINAALVSIMQCVKRDVNVLGVDHLPKELNDNSDRISRRAETKLSLRQLVDSSPVMAGAEIIDLQAHDIVLLSDPMRRIDTPSTLAHFWTRTCAALDHEPVDQQLLRDRWTWERGLTTCLHFRRPLYRSAAMVPSASTEPLAQNQTSLLAFFGETGTFSISVTDVTDDLTSTTDWTKTWTRGKSDSNVG